MVLITSSNPLRSFANTTAYQKAFSKLDLLLTVEVAMADSFDVRLRFARSFPVSSGKYSLK